MRMPGHGTAPSGLTTATWEDMAAAVRIGVRHVRAKVPGRPVYLVGYSNGGALSVHHALSALTDDSLPQVDGIVLVSPMIGVTPAAAFAIWQERIGRLLGLEKLNWNSVGEEYDPFKYNSFAVNAGRQTHELTLEIATRLDEMREMGALERFPPVLAFQSAADGTVSALALISKLMGQLPQGGHELVLFDINRRAQAVVLLKNDPGPELAKQLRSQTRRYTLGVVTNRSKSERAILVRRATAASGVVEQTALDLEWPRELYSLSHIALPFPRTDPLYGDGSGAASPGVRLGDLALRGERGVLRVSAGEMLRIRWNPFYPYLERRTLEFVGLQDG
jgi:alpha-beta hydrolase superfamily lysophospholipase